MYLGIFSLLTFGFLVIGEKFNNESKEKRNVKVYQVQPEKEL